jgi:hypothetical protein
MNCVAAMVQVSYDCDRRSSAVRWGVQSSLLFSPPGSDNSVAYPIQAPFEGGWEESQIELCFLLWVSLCAVGGVFYALVVFLCFDLLLR